MSVAETNQDNSTPSQLRSYQARLLEHQSIPVEEFNIDFIDEEIKQLRLLYTEVSAFSRTFDGPDEIRSIFARLKQEIQRRAGALKDRYIAASTPRPQTQDPHQSTINNAVIPTMPVPQDSNPATNVTNSNFSPASPSTSTSTSAAIPPADNLITFNSDIISATSIINRKYIPKFSGRMEDWKVFETDVQRDLLTTNASNQEKFSLLYQALPIKDRELLAHINPQSPDLDVAFGILKNKYDDERQRTYNITRRLRETPVVKPDNLESWNTLYQTVQAVLSQLNAVDQHTNTHYFHHIMAKLPEGFRRHLERLKVQNISDLREHIYNEIGAVQRNELYRTEQFASTTSARRNPSQYHRPRPPSTDDITRLNNLTVSDTNNNRSTTAVHSTRVCPHCSQSHRLYQCQIEPDQIYRTARRLNLCFNCLSAPFNNRHSQLCIKRCRHCNRRHHTILHTLFNESRSANQNQSHPQTTSTSPTRTEVSSSIPAAPVPTINSVTTLHLNTNVLTAWPENQQVRNDPVSSPELRSQRLMTVQATVVKSKQRIRLLLDTGAQTSLMSERLVKELNLEVRPIKDFYITGVTGEPKEIRQLAIVSLIANDGSSITLSFLVVPDLKITNIQAPFIPPLKRYMVLAEEPGNRDPIETICGGDVLYHIIIPRQRKLDGLLLQKTIFGWTAQKGDQPSSLSLTTITDIINPPLFQDSELETYHEVFRREHLTYANSRYTARLPWISDARPNYNHQLADLRLRSLYNRLKREHLIDQYEALINEFVDNGFATKVTDTSKIKFFLPHHVVIRNDKETTKLRLVFDGSASNSLSAAINDLLFKGAVTGDVRPILTNFRSGKFAAIADIEKAFLQIKIDTEDTYYLCFMWFKDGKRHYYRMTSLPFGLSCSPYILQQVLIQHLQACPAFIPKFYVDDLLLSAHSSDALQQLRINVTQVLSSASMNLRKWTFSGDTKQIKVLGLNWDALADTISITAPNIESIIPPQTKRQLASVVSSIYDPLGLAEPLVLQLRFLLRKAWDESPDWDTVFSDQLKSKISRIKKIIDLIPFCIVPRCLNLNQHSKLHLFCDAGSEAYGAVLYAQIDTQLCIVGSKSKMVKGGTIPDLELEAVRYGLKLLQIYGLKPETYGSLTIWSDSTVTLRRLETSMNQLKPRIALKVKQIRDITATYRYVPTKLNPADWLTKPASIQKDDVLSWIYGNLPEVNVTTVNANSSVKSIPTDVESVLVRVKTFNSLLFLIKIITRWRKKSFDNSTCLYPLIRNIQAEFFCEEISCLSNHLDFNLRSTLRNYQVFLDQDGLLRLESRLSYASFLNKSSVYPIILPRQSAFTIKLIRHLHRIHGHMGLSFVLGKLREQYFVPKVRSQVKKVLRECLWCQSQRKQSRLQPLAPLPECRLQKTTPFSYCGVDFFGPMPFRAIDRKSKLYGIIWTCLTTRAVFLELTEGMTSHIIFMSYQKLCANYTTPIEIYSDNGRGFVKAANEYFRNSGTTWKFIHPYSPWEGGAWERLIGIVKWVFKAKIGTRRNLTYNELSLLMTETQGILNRRPVFYEDDVMITPHHFSHGIDVLPANPTDSISGAYKRITEIRNQLSKAVMRRYLLTSPSYNENRNRIMELKIGQPVLIKCANFNRETWPVGYITNLIPGKDGVIRYVNVRIGQQIRTKSVGSIIPLEIRMP